MKTRISLLLVLLVGLGSACGPERSERWDQPLEIDGPQQAGDRLLYLNRTAQNVTVVTPTRDGDELGLETTIVDTGAEPGVFATSPDDETLYVVNEEDETLQIVDLTDETFPSEVVNLQGAYDVIDVDPWGEFILLSFSGDDDDEIIARNLNEIGIVDLRSSPPQTEFVTLSSRPNSIEFAPPFEFDGNPQRIAAVMADSEVTVLDLLTNNDEDRKREVGLTLDESDLIRRPRAVEFDVTPPEDGEPEGVEVYVLAENSSDVTAISVSPSGQPDPPDEEAPGPTKYSVSAKQLAAGQTPGTMALLQLDGGPRLITLDNGRAQFTMIDVVSGESATFDLPMDVAAQRLLVYQTTIQVDGETQPETRVLAYSTRTPLLSVIRPETISIAGDEPTLGRSVEAIRLERQPTRVRLAEGQLDRALVFHQGSNAGFTILDLRKNNDIPIQGGVLRDVYFDGTNAYAVFQSLRYFTVFDLDGHPNNYDLPRTGKNIFVFSDPALNAIVVQHSDAAGGFTILDGTEPVPDTAKVYSNVFLHELFDQRLEP